MFPRVFLVLLLSMVCPLRVSADWAVDDHTVLAPIFLEVPVEGANGSRWVSEFRVMNLGSARPDPIPNLGLECEGIDCGDGGRSLPLNVSVVGFTVREHFTGLGPGALLFVRPDSTLSFQLRVRDTSREADRRGTWLPIVRRQDARSTAAHLLGIPADSKYRHTLRVYCFAREAGLRARIRVFATDPDPKIEVEQPRDPDPQLAEFVLPLVQGMGSSPSYLEFAGLSDIVVASGAREFRVIVEPENGVPMWSMITVTNNVTQEFTAVLPDQID